jgi:hypothetical protein
MMNSPRNDDIYSDDDLNLADFRCALLISLGVWAIILSGIWWWMS